MSSRRIVIAFVAACAVWAGCAYRGPVGGSAVAPAGDELAASGTSGEELWIIARDEANGGAVAGAQPRPNPDPATTSRERGLATRNGANASGVGASFEPEFQPEDLEPSQLPGCGGIVAQDPVTQHHVVVPLKHTDVRASVRGTLGDVAVTQQFVNPFGVKIEAIYVFPLPADAAVRDFVMTVGQRQIRGIIRERAEATRIYESAKRQGKVAALLTEERPNVFTQKLANLEPGAAIDVTLRYLHTLPFVDGAFEFVFPMVVGPRYTPPGSRSGIGAVGTDTLGSSGQPVEVPYLRTGERSGHDIALAVDVDTGFDLAGIECRTHEVRVDSHGKSRAQVVLSSRDSLPNKDFVLRLRPESGAENGGVQAGLLAQQSANETCFTLTLVPPPQDECARLPIEVIFVVDSSGSMEGAPLAIVRSALHRALDVLRPGDGFQLVRFSDTAEAFARAPVSADAANLAAGHGWIDALRANGGTQVMSGVDAALGLARDPARERLVCFLTDGFLSNEDEVLAAIHRRRGDVRVFAVGIGSAPNRHLITGLASEGRGATAFVTSAEDASSAMGRFLERTSRPALTDLAIDWGRLAVADLAPRELPDLFPGRAVVITGRITGGLERLDGSAIRVTGRSGGGLRELVVPAREISGSTSHSVIPVQWARARIADLASQARVAGADEQQRLTGELKRVALAHALVSPFTAFVAVDAWSQTSGDHGISVPVPAVVPAGMRYDTSVRGGE